MGKFLNTSRKDTMNTLVDGFKERLKNPYYLHNDKKATIVTYYNINKDQSTLDEGLKIEHTQIIKDSAFRYNQIDDFYLYGGLEQMPLDFENGDFGLQSGTLSNSSVILPNTIIPMPGDFFSIQYMNRPALFEVVSVNTDTLESGANMYRIDFEYSKKNSDFIKPLVVEHFKMIVDNTGSSLKCIIKKDAYDYVSAMDAICIRLREYYHDMFFYEKVEAFILQYYDAKFYDASMVEFIIRNKIMESKGDSYSHIAQQIYLPRTFNIDYDKTFFRALESKKIKQCNYNAYGTAINQPLSSLSMFKENYFSLNYVKSGETTLNKTMEIFNPEIFDKIKYNELYYVDNSSESVVIFDGKLTYVDENGLIPSRSKYKGNILVEPVSTNFNVFKGKILVDPIPVVKFKGMVKTVGVDNLDVFKGQLSFVDGKDSSIFKGSVFNLEPKYDTSKYKGVFFNDNSYNISIKKINNIIIKYFNDGDITEDDIENLESLNYMDTIDLFYNIPIVIFILEQYIMKHLSKEG